VGTGQTDGQTNVVQRVMQPPKRGPHSKLLEYDYTGVPLGFRNGYGDALLID